MWPSPWDWILVKPEPQTSNILKGIGAVYKKIERDKKLSNQDRDNALRTLNLAWEWGDWGIPLEELMKLVNPTEDPYQKVNELLDIINTKFTKLKGERFAIRIYDDHQGRSTEGKTADIVSLDAIENPREVTLWLDEIEDKSND